jgi:iron complex outermembrane recepter protein
MNPAVQIGNVGSAEAQGAELEVSVLMTEGLTLRAGVTYSDVTFGNGVFDISSGADCALIPECAATRLVSVNGVAATDVGGSPLPRQSKLQFVAGFDLERALSGEWRWFAGSDYSYLSKQYFETSNFAYWGDRNLLNGRIGVTNGRLRVSLWGENLTDEGTPINAESNLRLTDFVFETLPILPEQRTYGVSASYRF